MKRPGRLTGYASPTALAILYILPLLCIAQPKSDKHPSNFQKPAGAGIQALQGWYSQETGLYETTGWWNSANAITVVGNYMQLSQSREYRHVVAHTFATAQHNSRNFLNKFYDDEGWWALAWLSTYDVTKNPKYLAMAEVIFKDMAGGWSDDVCGGGIWWSKDRDYKNAIANELFLSVAAHLANRVTDAKNKAQYIFWAEKEWRWFQASGMINGQGLVNDGLNSERPLACANNGKTTWSYNQGVILAGLTELFALDHDPALITVAHSIAEAAMNQLTDVNGILHDECEPSCGQDGVQFKGIFLRNMMVLQKASPRPEYKKFAETNAASIWMNSQNERHQFGQVWSGPFDGSNAGSQSAALDAMIAAAEMDKQQAK